MTRVPPWRRIAVGVLASVIALGACAAVASADATPSALTVVLGGDGTGSITSDSGGIDCTTGTCTASFDPTTSVILTAAPGAGSAFTGFGNACTGQTCTVLMSADATVTANFDLVPTITSPVSGTDYAHASVPSAAFACAAGDTACTATLDGQSISSAGAMSAAPGSHTLTVSGVAADGASVAQTASYTVSAPPQATITAPADGQSYAAGEVPTAAFTCTPDPHSAPQSCTAMVDGTTAVQAGEPMPAAPGSTHTLTVIATDADGSSSPPATATYTVYPPPTCGDVSATTNEGVAAPVRLRCTDPNASLSRYTVDAGPQHGSLTATSRDQVLTYTPHAGFAGTDSFTYHGTSADGVSADQTATIVVLAPPTAQIAAPAAGQVYAVGQVVPTRFSCADDPHGPGLRSCTDSGGASGATGTLNTSIEGSHSYTVAAVSRDGLTGTARIDYTVVGKAPEVVIAAPVNNAAYLWTAVPAADFTCIPGTGSTLESCKATSGGQVISDHQGLSDALGTHVVTVTATDADGLSSTETATYTVTFSAVPPPPVSIQAPVQGAGYRLGQAVAARYSCLASSTGPALKSCVGSVPAGHRINTRTLGSHPFSVSATDDQGESTTETVTYKVVPTTNRFEVLQLRATSSGAAQVALKLPGPGAVRVLATAWNAARGASARRLSYGTVSAGARRGGPLELVVKPTGAGRALLRTHGARPVVALRVTYTPTGARPRVVRLKLLRLS
jgi:hypothetical protein